MYQADARAGEALFGAWTYTLTHRSQSPESDPDRTHGRSPVLRAGPQGVRATLNVSRCQADVHVGEALFGGPTHGAPTLAISREEHLA
jgi:hypothetical protein